MSFSFLPCRGWSREQGKESQGISTEIYFTITTEKQAKTPGTPLSNTTQKLQTKTKAEVVLVVHLAFTSEHVQVNLPSWKVHVYQLLMLKPVQPRSKTSFPRWCISTPCPHSKREVLEDPICFHFLMYYFLHGNRFQLLMSRAKNKVEEMMVLYVILLPPDVSQNKVLSITNQMKGTCCGNLCVSVPTHNFTPLQKHSWLKTVLLITSNYVVVLLMHDWFWSFAPIINITHYNKLGQRWVQFVYFLISN